MAGEQPAKTVHWRDVCLSKAVAAIMTMWRVMAHGIWDRRQEMDIYSRKSSGRKEEKEVGGSFSEVFG